MKRCLLLISILLAIVIVFTACTSMGKMGDNISVKDDNQYLDEKTISIRDYYPFRENTIMRYEGIGNEFAQKEIIFEFIEGDKAQIKIFNPGTTTVNILEYNGGELINTFSESEFYHIESMLDMDRENNEVILKEPLEVGTIWNIPGGYKRSITGVDVDIETPYGKFKALEIVTEFEGDRKEYDYYVKGIGPVASIYNDGNFETMSLLKEIENMPYNMEIRFYYPLYSSIATAYVDEEIQFSTNESIENILEYKFKNPPSDGLIPPISQNTRINSIELDRGNRTVRIDFSNELLKDMNVGSSLEAEMLKSIANTLGNYYRVEKVYISTEGIPYNSGHFSIKKDEYFTVDEKDTIEFKD